MKEYDVSLSILLLEVIHVANARPQQPEQLWLEEVPDNFRQTALLGANIGLDLDPGQPQARPVGPPVAARRASWGESKRMYPWTA